MIVHTDMPFDNYPQRWEKDYHHTVVPRCLYINRELFVLFPGDILREFYGVNKDICTYLVLTTTESSIQYEGFKAPLEPGCYEIQWYAMEGTVIVEAGIPTICIESDGLPTGYEVFLNSRDTNYNSILELRFTSNKVVPNGYFYLDGNYPGD